jgi:2-haloacid dehalogenase
MAVDGDDVRVMTRRSFVAAASLAAVAVSVRAQPATFAAISPIQAVAFDALAVFDPRPMVALAERLFPGRGNELCTAWRTRQFEYGWLRVLMNQYLDFWHVTEDALVVAAKMLSLDLTPQHRDALLSAHQMLDAWPDVPPALKALKAAGVRLALLSNFTAAMLEGCVRQAKLEGMFDLAISTDEARTYKPDGRAYQLGVDHLKLPAEQILFVAFAGWDAAGAKAFGYPTYWANRQKLPAEALGFAADAEASDLSTLMRRIGR